MTVSQQIFRCKTNFSLLLVFPLQSWLCIEAFCNAKKVINKNIVISEAILEEIIFLIN